MAFFISEQNYCERRQSQRIKINSPIEYRFLNSDKFQNSVSCDISEGGISFKTDGPVPVGTHLYFFAKLKNKPQPLYGIAKIVWSSKEPYSEKYRIGLEFLEVGSESKADISSIIYKNKAKCFSA